MRDGESRRAPRGAPYNFAPSDFMATDDELIAGILDERWRTVVQIRSLLGIRALPKLTVTLRRLAATCDIKRRGPRNRSTRAARPKRSG